jgi:hypothetical protein
MHDLSKTRSWIGFDNNPYNRKCFSTQVVHALANFLGRVILAIQFQVLSVKGPFEIQTSPNRNLYLVFEWFLTILFLVGFSKVY